MDPLSALIVAVWAAYYLIRDSIDGVTSAKGNIPHGAMNHHAERMKRLDQAHEKWMARHAERQTLRERGHSTLGRALENRIAKWVENAGRRVDRADDAVRVAEKHDVHVGRTPGQWRTSWRRARQAMARKWQSFVERAEERLSDRYDRDRPFAPTEPAAKVVTEETPRTQDAPPRPESGTVPPPAGLGSHGPRATTGGGTDIVDAEIVDEPDPASTPPQPDVIDAEVVEDEIVHENPGKSVDDPAMARFSKAYDNWQAYLQIEAMVREQRRLHPDVPIVKCKTCGEDTAQGVDPCPWCLELAKTQPKTPASRELEAAAPPSNVIPINRGEHRMSEPIQTLVLSSGETINPETGIAFADGLAAIYAEIDSRVQASIANLSGAGVAQDQIAKLSELLNLNSAAKGKADEMKDHFTDHQNAAALVGATGAGTHAGYLGQH